MIDKTADQVIVHVKEKSPRPGGVVDLGVNSPFHIVKTEKLVSPVTFEHSERFISNFLFISF